MTAAGGITAVLLAGWALGCGPAQPARSADEPLIVVVAAPDDRAPVEVEAFADEAGANEADAAEAADVALEGSEVMVGEPDTPSVSVSLAPPASAAVKQAAKAAYLEATRRLSAGDYAGALSFFRQADSLYPGASPKHYAAVCLDKLGRLREAALAYEDFIRSNPSPRYQSRVAAAKQRIAEIRASLP